MPYLIARFKSALRLTQRPHGRVAAFRSFGPRILHALIIVALLLPSLGATARAAQPPLTSDEIEERIKAVADQPLTSTPVRLRRAAFETLMPVAVDAAPGQGNPDVLPAELVNHLLEDNEAFFFDEGRLTDGVVLDHDWELAKQLVRLLRSKRISSDLKQAYLQGLLFLLQADRHIAELAVHDARVIVDGMSVSGNGGSASDQNEAQAHLNTAEIRLRNGLDALRRGDADSAVQHFGKAWAFSARVLSVFAFVYGGNLDDDGVVDVVELRIGSSPFAEDTDGDGLSDFFELNSTIPHTLPNVADTDGDGLPDGEEDLDGDGLTNLAERDLSTDPLLPDSDGDGLGDREEALELGLNPLDVDTDGDGLADDSELRLGTNPLDPDSDDNGIPDGADEHPQRLDDPDLGVTVDLLGIGDHSKTFQVHTLPAVAGLSDAPGLVSAFVDLATELPLTSATVRLRYDPALVPDGDFENLRLFRYDVEEAILELLPNQQVDVAASEVSAETNEFSPFGILHLPALEEAIGGDAMRPGFDSTTYGPNDDGTFPCTSLSAGTPFGCTPTTVPLGFTINFFGTNYSSLFVNNNGNATFDAPLAIYTPFDLTTTGRVIIAPYFADVDTRVGNLVTFGPGTVEGRAAFGINWPGVGCYSRITSVLNYFQVLLIDRSDIAPGDFDIELNHDAIQWETGQASGGDFVCQGGASARVGFSNGTREPGTFFELPGSGIPGSFLDSNISTGLIHNSLNSTQLGRYVFPVRTGAPVPEQDSDLDGLTDGQETSGFRTQFGNLVFTDPFKADTDGDGISDLQEIGPRVDTGVTSFHKILSDPRLVDTDGDGVEDFVELLDLPQPLNPFDPDTDNDGLSDGEEVNDFATDPRVADTDGDGVRDGDEVREGEDPLLATERLDALKVATEFAIGALCGEFCLDDPAHGNMAFFAGFFISGAISVIPTPVTAVIGLIADLRDFFAALIKGDWAGLGFNTVALLPYVGDATDALGSIGRFVFRHAGLVGEVGGFVSRLDWLPEAIRIGAIRVTWGDEVIDALGDLGFDPARALRLSKAGVDLGALRQALRRLLDDFPGVGDYLRTINIDEATGILRNNTVTANLKKLAAAQRSGEASRVAGALSNIAGAYTESLLRGERLTQGWELIQDLRHVNAAGYDLVARRGGIMRLLEAKSGARVPLDGLSNYFRRVGGELRFNTQYFIRQLGEDTARPILRSGNLEIEIFLNNPGSQTVAQTLLNEMGGTIARYSDDINVEHQIQIIVTAVSR